jgi:hypothetical protein
MLKFINNNNNTYIRIGGITKGSLLLDPTRPLTTATGLQVRFVPKVPHTHTARRIPKA